MAVNRILGSFLIVSMTILTSIGCGSQEAAVPAPEAADQQKMDEYYKQVEEAEAKGIDPATIPAP